MIHFIYGRVRINRIYDAIALRIPVLFLGLGMGMGKQDLAGILPRILGFQDFPLL